MSVEYDFNKIYKEYYQKIIQYVSRMVGENEAEDIAQEVFNKISRNLSGFRGKSKLSSWIYRIATHTAIDRLRSASHKHSTQHCDLEEASGLQDRNIRISHQPPATDHAVIRKEMSECVKEYIDNLPLNYKTVIILSELEGLSNVEIASVMEISPDNVKIRLHRARAKLREALNAGCDFYHNEHNVLACDRKQPQMDPKSPK